MSLNVMIVDDSVVMRKVIEKTLRLTDLDFGTIHHAGNGREALDLLKDHWVDVLFVDINMPVMNGLELVDQLAKDNIMSSIPVFIISTEGNKERIDDLRAKGIRGYLRKPFQPEDLKEMLELMMNGSK